MLRIESFEYEVSVNSVNDCREKSTTVKLAEFIQEKTQIFTTNVEILHINRHRGYYDSISAIILFHDRQPNGVNMK